MGARRLQRATVGMVVLGVGGVAGLAVHDAQLHQASSGSTSTSTSVSQGSTTESATDGTNDGSTTNTSGSGGSSTLLPTQSLPQATSGGS